MVLKAKFALAVLAAWLGLCGQVVRAEDWSKARLARHDAKILALVDQALARSAARPGARALATCPRTPSDPWPGLTISEGRVTTADIVAEIVGFARTAETRGGLGGDLKIVTTTADYQPGGKESVIPGSVRAAVEDLARAQRSGWIVFAPELGPTAKITLKAPLRLSDNVTIDGRCIDLTLETTHDKGIIYIFGKRNIIVAGLSFRKSDYRAGQPDAEVESCIRLNAKFDAIAILHNDLERCGDGLIDLTISPHMPLPEAARVTIAYNSFRDHDKSMLFGTFMCADGTPTFPKGCNLPNPGEPARLPAFYLTLEGNLFYRTGQRHPRVFGRAYAHITNNVILFEEQPQNAETSVYGSAYGTFVSSGASALIERNVYLSIGHNNHPSGVWTTTSPGAESMKDDTEGAIRLSGNLTTKREVMTDNRAETVAEPIYRAAWWAPSFRSQSISQAITCIASRAGRGGRSAWSWPLCGS